MSSSKLIQACNRYKLQKYIYYRSECLNEDIDELLTESPGNMFHNDIA